jgi:hypothetical protein
MRRVPTKTRAVENEGEKNILTFRVSGVAGLGVDFSVNRDHHSILRLKSRLKPFVSKRGFLAVFTEWEIAV